MHGHKPGRSLSSVAPGDTRGRCHQPAPGRPRVVAHCENSHIIGVRTSKVVKRIFKVSVVILHHRLELIHLLFFNQFRDFGVGHVEFYTFSNVFLNAVLFT